MWTLVRLKTPDPSVEFKRSYIKYAKILLIIRSCRTSDHAIACAAIINNFHAWLTKHNVSKNVISKLVASLEGNLNLKIQEIKAK